MLDIVALDSQHGKAHLLSDGLLDVDNTSLVAKMKRERLFPIDILQAGLGIRVTQAEATMPDDKVHILNAVADREDLTLEPDLTLPVYGELDRGLHGLFAVRAWPQVIQRGDSGMSQQVAEALRLDSSRHHLKLAFGTRCADADLALIAHALSGLQLLEDLQLGFAECAGLSTLEGLAPGFVFGECLRSLSLQFLRCTRLESMVGLEGPLSSLSALERLEIDFSGCSGLRSLDALASLVELPLLSHLKMCLHRCSALESLGRLVGEALGSCVSLSHLVLDFSNCANLACVDALSALGNSPALKKISLDFSGCLKLVSIQEVECGVAQLSHLEEIDVSFNYCTSLSFDSVDRFEQRVLELPTIRSCLVVGIEGNSAAGSNHSSSCCAALIERSYSYSYNYIVILIVIIIAIIIAH